MGIVAVDDTGLAETAAFAADADHPGPGTLCDVIGPDLPRPHDGSPTRRFAPGRQVVRWHEAAMPSTP